VTTHQRDIDVLRTAVGRQEPIFSVHYACESFIKAKDHPPGIAAIALSDLENGEVIAFSRTDCPEGTDTAECEIDILRRFYEELQARIETICLHWNMDRPEYGFAALATRWRYLTLAEPPTGAPRQRYDADNLLVAQFGVNYAPHGKLASTAKLNDLDMRSFLSGAEEAAAYDSKDWATLTRSASSKAKIIGQLFLRTCDGSIKTSNSAGIVMFAGSHLDAVQIVLILAERFRYVQVRLKDRRKPRPPLVCEDEYDDQYLYQALLAQFFDDVREEEYTPSYAGGNSRIDFILPQFKVGIELKHTRAGLKDKDLGEELLVDRERYNQHPNVTHLIVIVFDYENRLKNPRGIEADLQREHSHPDLTVTVKIIDR
jgi:REase_DpnII-MboI